MCKPIWGWAVNEPPQYYARFPGPDYMPRSEPRESDAPPVELASSLVSLIRDPPRALRVLRIFQMNAGENACTTKLRNNSEKWQLLRIHLLTKAK